MKVGHVLGGKRRRPKKDQKKRKQVKVALKVKGTVKQVHSAIQKIAKGPEQDSPTGDVYGR